MFKILDGRDSFYQWDLDRKLIVEDETIKQVHFCNKTDDCSLVCQVYEEDGLRVVDVPNILLQTDWRINVYGYDVNYTKYNACFNVVKRTKPADYVYTETELYTVEAVVEEAIKPIKTALAAEKEAREQADKSLDENITAFQDDLDNFAERANDFNTDLAELFDRVGVLEQGGTGGSVAGFEILAQTTLTEAAQGVQWTQGDNGEVLADYKDFFIYWSGHFDTTVSSHPIMCNGSDGAYYFCYAYYTLTADKNYGGYFEIKEIYNKDKLIMYKGSYPAAAMTNFSTVAAYNTQGLSGNNQTIKGDFTCRTDGHKISNLSVKVNSGTNFKAGTRFIVMGVKR